MKVELKYGWFGPNATFYDKGIRDIPDDLYDKLPSTAKIVTDTPVPTVIQEQTLKDFDELRANSDATQELLNKFNKENEKAKS